MSKIPLWVWFVVGGFLLLGGGAAVVLSTKWRESAQAKKYVPMLNAIEKTYGIPTDLLARQAYQESRFRDDIVTGKTVSSSGAKGLMQIVPKWHPDISEADILNPQKAADYAARYLTKLKNQFGSWKLALAAYNAGPGNVQKYNGVPPFTETQNYVAQIGADVPAALV